MAEAGQNERVAGANQRAVRYSVSTVQQPVRPAGAAARAVLTELAARIGSLGSGRLRVAIDGPTAAGKTSFGHQLAEQISRAGRPVLRASLDDFKRPWRDRHLYDRESGEGYYRNAYDYDAVIRLLLEPAGPTGTGACALCSIDPLTQLDHSAVLTAVSADAVLIVDGVFAFRPQLNDYWDCRIWLEADERESLDRGARRDRPWAGSEAQSLLINRYLPAERLYREEVDPVSLADVRIDNSDVEHPRLLSPGAETTRGLR